MEEIKNKIATTFDSFKNFIDLNKASFCSKLKGEIIQLKIMYKDSDKIPINLEEALAYCNEDIFPTLMQFLKMFYTLPISVASAESSYSTLKGALHCSWN